MYAVPEPVLDVVRRLRTAGHAAVIVGGPVRDLILGREPRDWDVATSASGPQVAELFPRINPVGMRHNTVGVYHAGFWVEVTSFRDPAVTLEGDLALRDFTINAMALEPESGRLIDPLGGEADIANRRLRACVDAEARFREDPLRALRAARFLAELGFSPDDDVTAAAAANRYAAARCAVERIRDEWLKLIVGDHVRLAFAWMAQTGLFAVLFPAVAGARGVAQNRYHRWDVYTHTVETVARAPHDAEVRLAALFHDLGKPAVKRLRDDWTFHGHERVSAEIAHAELERYRFGGAQRDRVVALVAHHMFHYEPDWSDAAVRRFVRRVGPALIDPLFALRKADSSAAGLGGEEATASNLAAFRTRIDRELSERHALAIRDLAIDGNDVRRLAGGPGPLVGLTLRELLERVTDDPGFNSRDRLLAEAEAIVGRHTRSS